MDHTVFKVHDELFGIPVLLVQEISRTTDIYPVPGHDPRIAGMVNLRGNTVTVIDMRACLFPRATDYPKAARAKLITLAPNSALSKEASDFKLSSFVDPLLLLVDDMYKVIPLVNDAIAPPPAHLHEPFIDGVIKEDGLLITMISVSRLIETIHS